MAGWCTDATMNSGPHYTLCQGPNVVKGIRHVHPMYLALQG